MGKKLLDVYQHLEAIEEKFGESLSLFSYFPQMIKEWKEIVRCANPQKRDPKSSLVGNVLTQETYIQTIDFYDNQEFIFEWDIVEATEWINKNNLQLRSLFLPNISNYICKSDISFDRPERKTPYHPIIVIETCIFGNEIMVLNGNHRIINALMNGNKVLDGYVISGNIHIQWMLSELMQVFYECYSDLRKIENALFYKALGKEIDDEILYRQLNVFKRKKR